MSEIIITINQFLKSLLDYLYILLLILKIIGSDYEPIRMNYSSELKSLISKLLQKDPDKRPTIFEIIKDKCINKIHIRYKKNGKETRNRS